MPVRPEKEKELAAKMKAAGLFDADLEEKFVRSSGRGGQKINKTATCVYLKHRPTGLEVKMQKDRSQAISRFLARRTLLEKFLRQGYAGTESARQTHDSSARAEAERRKIRKQKKRRARSGRLKRLQGQIEPRQS